MGRKIHMKKIRSRDEYNAVKAIGAPVLVETTHGKILLNLMKHYIYKKPYKDEEYQSLMIYEIKKRRDAYDKSKGGSF